MNSTPINSEDDIAGLVRGDVVEFYPAEFGRDFGVAVYLGRDANKRMGFAYESGREIKKVIIDRNGLRPGGFNTVAIEDKAEITFPQIGREDIVCYVVSLGENSQR